ncbi:colorectal cancer associated 2 [Lampris incognitus]|uniref:colorectal cancer associated 2 n=1 Tax=Lampris incognitus TaxID=2546036 RepID=UPI0024B4E7DF|nr:colorectal cancer associated 2 [Lampris incognitus]
MLETKPRVYQGVRVKTTVKELLQRHRARQADVKKVKTIPQGCTNIQDLCAPTFPSHYTDAAAVRGATASGAAPALPVRALLPADGGVPMQGSAFTNQLFSKDAVPPANCYDDNNNNNNSGSGGSVSQSFSLPWSYGRLSSDADYYGQAMAPSSPQDYLKLPRPLDHNSYSPQDSFSSSSSSCYNSPTRMDLIYNSFTPEHYDYQHCSLQDSGLSHCWPDQQESLSALEYAPYFCPTDYPYIHPAEEDYFKRDLPMAAEMCYNVL